eukprot:gene10770-12546_t
MEEKEKQLLVNEVNILQKLKHSNIVRYYDRIIDKSSTKIFILMEYCTGGDLSQLITKCKNDRIYIDEEVIWRTLFQILSALSEIHNRKDGIILHRDIKPGNLFLDESRNVKLGDFGLAKILTNSVHAHTFVGTPHYMSPEQIHGLPYNNKSDVWSVGCVIYEMATHRPPFYEATTHHQLYAKIHDGRYDSIPSHYSSDLSTVIAMMMNLDHMEEDLKNKEKMLIERERQLALREQQVLIKEQQLLIKEHQQLPTSINVATATSAIGKENVLIKNRQTINSSLVWTKRLAPSEFKNVTVERSATSDFGE